MPRKSKVKTLPAPARKYIEQLLREDRLTLTQMIAAIEEKFPDAEAPSRSGLHRYKRGFDELTARMREIEVVSEAVVGELGEGVGEKAGALLAQAITTLATNAALQAQTNDKISIEEIRKLARAAKDAIGTRTASLAERQKIEQAALDRQQREQKQRLDQVAKARGMSADAVETIRREILGIAA